LNQALKVVSLFDGISCGRVALERAGYAVSSYIAFEIDKFARAITRHNYPDTEHCGDVLQADFSKYTGYDLLMGGSPCSFWSIAKKGREVDKTGMGWKLFMAYVEAVRIVKPRFFFYENVKSMPANIKAYISEELGVEPILIDSALVSAQQRKRLYWTNIPNVFQPQDKGILLRDIIDSGVTYTDKAHCMVASYQGAVIWNSLERGQRTMIFEPVEQFTLKDKAQTLCAHFYKENVKSLIKRRKHGFLVADEIVQTDSVVGSPVRVGIIGTGGQGSRIYSVHGKTITLMGTGAGAARKQACTKLTCRTGIISSAS
jgi:DNA (cytosine-5)-methyltransferase 3A